MEVGGVKVEGVNFQKWGGKFLHIFFLENFHKFVELGPQNFFGDF